MHLRTHAHFYVLYALPFGLVHIEVYGIRYTLYDLLFTTGDIQVK